LKKALSSQIVASGNLNHLEKFLAGLFFEFTVHDFFLDFRRCILIPLNLSIEQTMKKL
tara:strand:- start:272 stop:445 length:174 start_codon:yes stop_codon:yes gene_type:complete